MNHRRVRCYDCSGSVTQPRDRDARFDAAGNRVDPETIELRIGDDKGAAFERLDLLPIAFREFNRFAGGINSKNLFEQ